MSPQSESKGMLWTGRVITTLVVLFMLFDSITKVLKLPMVVEPSAKVGITANMIFWIGVTLLVSTILYAIPHTSVLGAILVCTYLGGAVCADVITHAPAANSCMAIAFGILAWLGIWLREPDLRGVVPFRS